MVIRASFRLKTVFGILSTTVIGYGLFGLKASALPTEQIVQEFNFVSKFTILDNKGKTSVVSGENETVTRVLISQRDTADFEAELNRFRTEIDGVKNRNERILQEAENSVENNSGTGTNTTESSIEAREENTTKKNIEQIKQKLSPVPVFTIADDAASSFFVSNL